MRAAGSEPRSETSIEGRIREGDTRVHILTGAVCNNNCIFCMEEDREGRIVTNSATTDETVQWILANNPEAAEVCFTSGEPTTNRAFPKWVAMAKRAGVPTISVMTNGRALSYERYAKGLAAAGINKFYVSIHGHTRRLHEGLTRTPKSFEQTVAGLDVITGLKKYGIALHTSTVITHRNLPHVADIYRFLRRHGVDQVVFNVMQANGRANTYFDQLFPTYTDIAATFAAFVAEASTEQSRVDAFLVDIPLCTTEAVPDFNRGYVERYVHFEPTTSDGVPAGGLLDAERLTARTTEGADGLVQIHRSDLDDAERTKAPGCSTCRYDSVCEGVWGNYTRRYGWDEFVPVPHNEEAAE